jgi:hypothetical protein
MITLAYEKLRAIFREARRVHNPTEFTTEVGDEEENPYAERNGAERRAVQARSEECFEIGQWVTQLRAETNRRLAETLNEERVEIERRVAEVRTETNQRLAETLNEERLKIERRVAVEVERRLAEQHPAKM